MQNFDTFLLVTGLVIIVGFLTVALIKTRSSRREETQEIQEPQEPAVDHVVPAVSVEEEKPVTITPTVIDAAEAMPKQMAPEFKAAEPVVADLKTPMESSPVEPTPKPSDNANPFTNGEWVKVIRKTFKARVEHNNQQVARHDRQMGGLVIVNVMAQHGFAFHGTDIFNVLNNVGCRFGELGVFHKFNPKGDKLFSVSSAVEPGYFDVNNMNLMSTPGLTCFFDLEEVENPKYSYRTLLACAHELAHFLNGSIFDEHHQPMTTESIAATLARIKVNDQPKVLVDAAETH